MLAHAGEEVLYALVPLILFFVIYTMRGRRAARRGQAPPAPTGRCEYCGADIDEAVDQRCPRCGFRISSGEGAT